MLTGFENAPPFHSVTVRCSEPRFTRDAEVALRPVLKRMLLGGSAGTFIATGFAVWVSLLRIGQGTEPFDHLGTSYGTTITIYYATLPPAGAIVGLLYPIGRSRFGAMALGFLFLLPMYAAFVAVKTPPQELFQPFRVVLTILVAGLAGALLGYWIWSDDHGKSSS